MAGFTNDARRATDAITRQPILIGFELLLYLPVIVYGRPRGIFGLVNFLIVFVQAGWLGAQRIWYVRTWRGDPPTVDELPGLIRRFIGRFVVLGLVIVIVYTIPIFFVVQIVIHTALNVRGFDSIFWALLMATLAIDVLLTFATPALVFETANPLGAIRQGWKLLRTWWPDCALHAIAPPLAIQVGVRALPQRVGVAPRGVLAVTSAVLAVFFRGVILSYYERNLSVPSNGV